MATRFFIAAIVACIAIVAATSIVVGDYLTLPQQHEIAKSPRDLKVEDVVIDLVSHPAVSGWFVEGIPSRPGVLLLHGVRSNRLSMIERARFLNKAGYSVLLIDLQAHGESRGERITFGYLESIGANAALQYLRERVPGQRVGVIGVSLGGAAALLGTGPLPADAMILEAVYSSFEHAVENRISMRVGFLAKSLSPLFLWQTEYRLGVKLESLSPAKAISELTSPVLIIGGTDDQHTRPQDTKELFNRASKPKSLWMVSGAKHQDFHRFIRSEYERIVLNFFATYLKDPAT